MPNRMKRDLEETIHWLVNKEGPRLLVEAEGWTKAYWARTRYLLTWPVYGNFPGVCMPFTLGFPISFPPSSLFFFVSLYSLYET